MQNLKWITPLLIFSLLVSSINEVCAGDDPFTPKASVIRYWRRQITNDRPKPWFLLNKASPLSAVQSATFARLAADNALSTQLSSFCAAANLLCFPDPSPSLEKHTGDVDFMGYVNENFTNYGTKRIGGVDSFKNYSANSNVVMDTFRRYSRDTVDRKDKFANYGPNTNAPDETFNTYGTKTTGGSGEFKTYGDQDNGPTLTFTSYSDSTNGRSQGFTNYSEGSNVGTQNFTSYGKNGKGADDSFSGYGINSNVATSGFSNYGKTAKGEIDKFTSYNGNGNAGSQSFSSYGKEGSSAASSFTAYGNESNAAGSSFTGYGAAVNGAVENFTSYGDNGNVPGNNFKGYVVGANNAVNAFSSYRDQSNVGDDSFESYAKGSNATKVDFKNYGNSFNEGTDKFSGYGGGKSSNPEIGFKIYGVNNTFTDYAKKGGVTFASYRNDSTSADLGVAREKKSNKSVKRWVEPGKFFREMMLKTGTVMPMPDIRDKMPKRSFLPRLISSKLPFSTAKIGELKQIFHAGDDSATARMISDALGECERAPSRGETKRCVASIEDMIDFATSVLGRNVVVRTTDNAKGSKENVMIGSVRGINGGKVTKSVSCHQSLFPYLVYYCHSVPKVRVYEADLLDPKTKKQINHGVAICHVDTSDWSATHGAFAALGFGPGKIEVCHWIFEADLNWAVAD